MSNVLKDSGRQEVLDRLTKLTAESKARWGRMDVNQMLCHVADPMRIALGDLAVKDASNVFTRTLLRWLVLAGMPPPKGKVDTFPELDYAKGGGTEPAGFDTDLEALRTTLDRFVQHAGSGQEFVRSPGFGHLSSRAYGRLMYVHLKHHLDQFGV